MEAKAVTRHVRVSPRKARIVIDQIRGKSVPQAREILQFTNRAVAEVVEKTLNSAVANAENQHHVRHLPTRAPRSSASARVQKVLRLAFASVRATLLLLLHRERRHRVSWDRK